MEVLSLANLFGQDFTMIQTPGMCRFRLNIALYSDARSMLMRLLLLIGMPQREAMEYTPHSFRHCMPTLARQLHIPREDVADIGHWYGEMPDGV